MLTDQDIIEGLKAEVARLNADVNRLILEKKAAAMNYEAMIERLKDEIAADERNIEQFVDEIDMLRNSFTLPKG